MYLDGVLDGTVNVGANRGPRSDSAQHAGLGTAMNSTTGATAGFFAGTFDEARIWNVARSAGDIQGSMNSRADVRRRADRSLGHERRHRHDGRRLRRRHQRLGGQLGRAWVTAPRRSAPRRRPATGPASPCPGTVGSHVDLGPGSVALGATNYTLELWFKRTEHRSRHADGLSVTGPDLGHPADHEGPLAKRRRHDGRQLLPGHRHGHEPLGHGLRGRREREPARARTTGSWGIPPCP